jgi:hypothetical protein
VPFTWSPKHVSFLPVRTIKVLSYSGTVSDC